MTRATFPGGLRHRRQPTQWNCGVACVAMITGSSVAAVMQQLPSVRVSARRRRMKRAYVNVGELQRLIVSGGKAIGRRTPGVPSVGDVAVLRIPNHRITGWHWCVWARGIVHDPTLSDGVKHESYVPLRQPNVSFYQVKGL